MTPDQKEDFASILGMVSFALEFCHQPETYPVFIQWLTEQVEVDDDLISVMAGRNHLETYDRLITEWSAKLFEESHERQDKPVNGIYRAGRL